MKRIALPSLLVLVFIVNGIAQKSTLAPDLQSLVDAERAFARTATEKGVRDSFLAFIADDGILYRPGPVNGKEWLTPRPARPGLLTWQPVFADISSAGDLGITTGPWEYRQNGPQDEPIGYGQFSTVWRKQKDGTWKFVIDIGVQHDKPTAAVASWTLPTDFNVKKVTPKINLVVVKAALLSADQNYSSASVSKGAVKALDEFGSEGIRLLRNGWLPILGKKEASVFLAGEIGTHSWQPSKAEVAISGDLGYTYGSYEFKSSVAGAEAENGFYMRVWKKQASGEWKVILDVFNELPKQATS